MSSTYWTVAQTYANQEQRAVVNLRRQSYEVILPTILVRYPGRTQVHYRPMFPCYVLICLPVENAAWGPINSTDGIIRLLMSSGSGLPAPQRVRDHEMARLLQCLSEDDKGRQVLDPGTVVRTVTGRFGPGHDAVVSWSLDDRLGLLFTMLGREVEVEFSLSDIEVLE